MPKNVVFCIFEGAFFSLGHFRAPDRERGGGDLWAQVTAAHLFPLAYPIPGADRMPSAWMRDRPTPRKFRPCSTISLFALQNRQDRVIILVLFPEML